MSIDEPRRAATRAARWPCRRFRLSDAMILVGRAAVGFTGYRSGITQYSHLNHSIQVAYTIGFVLMLASWMVLILRLRAPRPPIRLLARQPGAVACEAIRNPYNLTRPCAPRGNAIEEFHELARAHISSPPGARAGGVDRPDDLRRPGGAECAA